MKKILSIFQLIISFLLLIYLFKKVSIYEIKELIFDWSNIFYYIGVSILLFLVYLLDITKNILIYKYSNQKLKKTSIINLLLITYVLKEFINNFSIIARGILNNYHSIKLKRNIFIIFVDKFSALIPKTIILIIGFCLIYELKFIFFIYLLLIIFSIAFLLIMIDKFKNIILKIIDLIKNDYKRFIYILFISSLIQSLIVLGYVLIAYSTNFDFNLGLFIFIFPLAMFIQVLPIAISQLGFREYIFMNIFIFFGMSGNQGVAISLIFAMLSLTILIIMYLLFSIFMYFSKHTYEK